jgi:hypothetical protein
MDGAAGEEERQRWPELADGEGEAAAAAGHGGWGPKATIYSYMYRW